MKLGAIPESLLERLALASGRAPTPLGHTIVALWLARTIMTATSLGVFEALADGAHSAAEVAAACQTDPHATRKLLDALTGAEYLRRLPPSTVTASATTTPVASASAETGERYRLTSLTRRWLLADSPTSLRDGILHQYLDLRFMEHYEDYVRTGEPLRIHEVMTEADWATYQRGMRSGARLFAPEVARRTPVPAGARDLLDIGGAHGAFSVALCQRHPGLRATILDLPDAIEQSAPLLAQELQRVGLAPDQARHVAGDARTADLGIATYDVIFISSLLHHFDEATNLALLRRAADALRPGGALVIQEVIRPDSPNDAGMLGMLADFYFSVTSESGAWSFTELAAWERSVGLTPLPPVRFIFAPGTGQQSARKSLA